ncbi:MAG: autotransporter domain-containing protein [Pseudomonadales bacterium]
MLARSLCLFSCSFLLSQGVLAQDPVELVLPGSLPGGSSISAAIGVSADGSTVVGLAASTNGTNEAFRWTQGTGMVALGDLSGGGFQSSASAVSRDGSVVAGTGLNASGQVGFRWTQATGMVSIGDLSGGLTQSFVNDISGDGTVIVGSSSSTPGSQAFRWTQATGMVGLGDLAGGTYISTANAVSDDGQVIVGDSNGANGNEAFRWTQAGGMVGLGELAGGATFSIANGVNNDGSVVVGTSGSASGTEAFRWTQADGMVGLGVFPGGTFTTAQDVSADGTVVVGTANVGFEFDGFRWTSQDGMQPISQWLGDNGVTVNPTTLFAAYGISDDASIIAGFTSTNEAFIARVPQSGPAGVININDFSRTLDEVSKTMIHHNSLQSLIINGVHSNPLQGRVAAGQKTVWLAGDVAKADSKETDGRQMIGEIGVGYGLSDTVNLRLSVGRTDNDIDTRYGGNISAQGFYLYPEVIANLNDRGLVGTFSALYSRKEASIKRGYLNGAAVNFSAGDTDVQSVGARVRFDWENAFALKHWKMTPYVNLSVVRTKTDAYTETGGSFPVSWQAVKERETIASIGVDGRYQFDPLTQVQLRLEGSRNFDDVSSNVDGQVIGLNSFRLDGVQLERNWVRAGVGIERKFGRGTLGAMLNVTTEQEGANNWLNLSYRVDF